MDFAHAAGQSETLCRADFQVLEKPSLVACFHRACMVFAK
jgi:hypothetical protein